MEHTLRCFWLLCLTPAPPAPEHQIFGFGEFVGTLVILIVVFQIVDFRYRFRLAILPINVGKTLLILFSIIGLSLLSMELWIAQGWLTLYAPFTPSIWQAFFALLFLGTFLSLTYAIYINPPVFSRRNARRFTATLYEIIVKGNDPDIKVVADELKRSSRHIVQLCATRKEYFRRNDTPEGSAYNVFGLIASPIFCRHVVEAAQSTVICLFEDIKELRKYDVPIGPFCQAVTEEAILNKKSILHYESEQFSSDLIGQAKPWLKAIYGDYQLIRSMDYHSPLHLHVWRLHKRWDVQHWSAYIRVILAILEGYGNTQDRDEGMTLGKCFAGLKWAVIDVAQENDSRSFYESDRYLKLKLVIDVLERTIDVIDSANIPITGTKKPLPSERTNVYDGLARLMYDVLLATSKIQGSRGFMWAVQHNMVWKGVFNRLERERSSSLAIVQSRVVRLLYEDIEQMDKIGPTYPGVRVVGLVLNALGLKEPSRQNYLPCERAIYRIAKRWAVDNYLQLADGYPQVAGAMLVGSLSFEEVTLQITKTYAGWLGNEGSREYLNL